MRCRMFWRWMPRVMEILPCADLNFSGVGICLEEITLA